MSKNQYNAPAMEVVEFGKEDIVCGVISNTSSTDWSGGSVDGPGFGGSSDGSQPDT